MKRVSDSRFFIHSLFLKATFQISICNLEQIEKCISYQFAHCIKIMGKYRAVSRESKHMFQFKYKK